MKCTYFLFSIIFSQSLRPFYAELQSQNIGKDLLNEYEKHIQSMNDRLDRIFNEGKADGEISGFEKGEKIGLEKGEKNVQKKAIIGMRAMSINDTLICQALGITEQQLRELMAEKGF
jgi:flagellar biosynthesis/type III secretory pathway protein FliH